MHTHRARGLLFPADGVVFLCGNIVHVTGGSPALRRLLDLFLSQLVTSF